MPAFGLIGGAVGIAGSLFGGKKAAKAARRSAGAENAVRRLQAARERASQIRSARQAIGQTVVSAAASGAESSSAITGQSGLLNQLQSNLNFINQTERLGEKVNDANQILRQGTKAGLFGEAGGSFLPLFDDI